MLARADKLPDALAGSRVGGIEQAPILLTPSELESDGGLSPELSAALDELQPESTVQLGDDAAISESVTALLAESYTVEVIGGETRLETAAQISELSFESATVTPETSSVIVANAGDANLVDALSAAAIGAASDTPVLLTFDDALAPETSARLTEIAPDVVYVAGGEASLPESITAQVAEAIPDDSTVEQVAGAERQSTSVAFAELGQEEFGFVALHLAGGTEALSDDVEQQAREAASTDCDDDGVPSGLFGVTAGPVTEVVQFGDDGSETRTPIVNVPAGLEVVGADVRSSTGLVYVLTDDGSVHIVTIDEPGVAATVQTVGNVNDAPQPGTPAGTATAPFDLTSGVGFDFNPSGPNALRIVTADGVNLRVAFDADARSPPRSWTATWPTPTAPRASPP